MIRILIAFAVLLALDHTASAQPPNLSGRWSGHWVSDKNGHTGPLRGRFRQVDEGTYRVAYHGRFWRIFPFYYRTTMRIESAGDGVVVLSASERLGPLGTFHTTALASGTSFNAVFQAARDSGRFVMSRRR